MNLEDRKELNRSLRLLWQKLIQIVVQSRLGEKICTKSKNPSKESVMFNFEIEDISEISQEVKKSCGNQIISSEKPFCIEILLRTKEGETMVLEVWTLSMTESQEPSPSNMFPVIYDRMCSLLKSAICVSRITPAWKLSFRQGPESYVICYRIYTGDPQHDCLGEKLSTNKIGQINIHNAYLTLQMSYRTNLSFPSPPRIPNDQMMLKSDHFKNDSSPIHFRRVGDKVIDTDNTQTLNESQEGIKSFTINNLEFQSASPRSRTSSESSHKGLMPNFITEKIYVPFATQKLISTDEYLSDLPLTNLIACSSADKAEESMQEIKELKERRISQGKLPKCTRVDRMSASTLSNKSAAININKDDADFVLVDFKMPFVESGGTNQELKKFFHEVQKSNVLHTFSDDNQDFENLSEELKKIEICADDYDDLVKSFNTDSQSSLELN